MSKFLGFTSDHARMALVIFVTLFLFGLFLNYADNWEVVENSAEGYGA